MVKITVVVPVYKVEPYLRQCVDSILGQSFRDFDLVLIDDGSPDSCGVICDEYARHDARVVVIHQANGGLSAARNAGIEWALKNSHSEWITFVDSDDWVAEDYLASLYEAADEFGASVAVGGLKAIDENGQDAWDECPKSNGLISPENLITDFPSLGTWACGRLFKKDDFCSVRFPVGKVYEDRHTTYKVLFKYPQVATVNRSLYYYRYKRPGNITGRDDTLMNIHHRVDGLCCQLDYFRGQGFKRAEQTIARDLMRWMRRALNCRQNDPERAAVEQLFEALKSKYWLTSWRRSDFRCMYRCAISPKWKPFWLVLGAGASLFDGGIGKLVSAFLFRLGFKKR